MLTVESVQSSGYGSHTTCHTALIPAPHTAATNSVTPVSGCLCALVSRVPSVSHLARRLTSAVSSAFNRIGKHTVSSTIPSRLHVVGSDNANAIQHEIQTFIVTAATRKSHSSTNSRVRKSSDCELIVSVPTFNLAAVAWHEEQRHITVSVETCE